MCALVFVSAEPFFTYGKEVKSAKIYGVNIDLIHEKSILEDKKE